MFDSIMQWMGLGANAELGPFALQVLKIIWIDIVLSGDNAVVIALACRSLPPGQRMMGIFLGALVAVGLRIIFALGIASLIGVPWLKLVGAVLLFWIAVKLVIEHGGAHEIAESTTLWGAVRTVAIADLVMSLDNVLAIAAAAKGSWPLIVFGLIVSVPIIVFGASLVMRLLHAYPILVWAGAALLGFIAGEMIVEDVGLWPLLAPFAASFGLAQSTVVLGAGLIGAALVIAFGMAATAFKRPAAAMAGSSEVIPDGR